MAEFRNDGSGTDHGVDPASLPALSLNLNANTIKIIEASKIKRLIGPLIATINEKGVKKIALVSWNNEETTRWVGQLLACALAQQIEKKCALVIAEGIRFNCDVYDAFNLITMPEISNPEFEERNRENIKELAANYPYQIIVGPNISTWDMYTNQVNMVKQADAIILLVPEEGLSRSQLDVIEKITKKNSLNWLGAISMSRGMSNE